MASLAREYGTDGLHFIICGLPTLTSLSDELRKQLYSSNFGLVLQSVEAVSKLNGKVPRSLADVELPIGRGFVVKSSRTMMVQIATPYPGDENIEGTLDSWIRRIADCHQHKAAWRCPPVSSQMKLEQQDDLKTRLLEQGVPEAMLAAYGTEDLIRMAKEFKII
jgi:hypothetical protein